MEELIRVLEQSIAKQGSVTLSTSHLLNILKMAQRNEEAHAKFNQENLDIIENEIALDQCGDRD